MRKNQDIALQVVFKGGFSFPREALIEAVRAFSPVLKNANGEFDTIFNQDGRVLGTIGWDEHVVRLVGFSEHLPEIVTARCTESIYYADRDKKEILAHKAYILLYYDGKEQETLEQYQVLTAVAASFYKVGGVGILNENGHTSLPTRLFFDDAIKDRLGFIRSLPPLMLFCGFLKYDVEGFDGIWMRTMGAYRLGLPDFALLGASHGHGSDVFSLFSALQDYLYTRGIVLKAGETLAVGEKKFFLRDPVKGREFFLEQDTPLFVLEPV